MHELSMTEALLDLTVQHATTAQAARVTDVYVVIGQLSAVIDESVQFYWDLLSAGTPAAGARLHFRRIAAVFCCDDCAHDYAPGADVLACPACGSLRVRLTAGDEFYLEALEVATEPEADAVKEPMP